MMKNRYQEGKGDANLFFFGKFYAVSLNPPPRPRGEITTLDLTPVSPVKVRVPFLPPLGLRTRATSTKNELAPTAPVPRAVVHRA